ncbi:Glycosyl transferase, family 1 [Acididesulfobacillus acetoxydans]|uniref:Glycosyl transferase, family 1 n=1 Tax=Acididesulfobacillus acetoxydans TaxID=1561005 RepID=A0A8S0W8Y3_9FIRM|nr:glycosyltransferase family 4 protein [Acididesulfobacillus acetoxydans]CAA7602189.1 Glycosyl transferase, family 1 [Acididesulfobacillus acetoxydans]CEJ08745.1 Glycosyl transferase, group 1 [Acididesulfobacillus acetoxydans]
MKLVVNLIYVTASFPYGPGEAFLIPEINELIKQGHKISILPLYPRGDLLHKDALPLLANTETVPLLSPRLLLSALVHLLKHPALLPQLLALIGRGQPKILLKNLAVLPKALWLARFASKCGAEHIHAHWATTTATAAWVAATVTRLPWSFTAHRWDIVENNLLPQKLTSAAFARFISLSGLRMAQEITPLPGGKCFVLHMGVSLPPSSTRPPSSSQSASPSQPYPGFRTSPAAEAQAPVLFCPANLIPVKGHRYLLLALALLKGRQVNPTLWLAGQGELLGELRHCCEKLGLAGQVRFLGQVAHEQLIGFYASRTVSAVVLPSVDLGHGLHEGIPVSLMEAMSFGIPTISTQTGGIPELLADDAGLLVPAKDAQALAAAIERLLSDSKLRAEVALKGYQRISDQFSASRTAAELNMAFQGHAEDRKNRRASFLPTYLL